MDLRRRKHERTSSLEAPLLSPEQADVDQPTSVSQHGDDHRALVPHSINKYDWEDLWRSLVAGCVQTCTTAWRTIVSCLSSLLPIRVTPSPMELSPEQEQQLQDLQARIQIPYDPEDEDHQALLRQLWSHAFPGEPSQLQSDRWKDMGWQGTDPATDFRGGGLVSLQNLLYLANKYPDLFSVLMHKSRGNRAQDIPLEEGGRGGEYPFAAAGVNFTHMLIELLGLRNEGGTVSSSAGQGFLLLFRNDMDVFDEVYCFAFELFDDMWLHTGKDTGGKWGYFDFNSIKSRLQRRLADYLSSQPRTLDELKLLAT